MIGLYGRGIGARECIRQQRDADLQAARWVNRELGQLIRRQQQRYTTAVAIDGQRPRIAWGATCSG